MDPTDKAVPPAAGGQSGEPSVDERRKYPRVPYGAWVEDLSHAGTLRFFLARNLSKGGILLQAATQPPPVTSRVRLRLVIENEKRSMTVDGSVIRHMPQEGGTLLFAVEFVDLDEERIVFLDELMAELSQSAQVSNKGEVQSA